ncbi:MAG: Gfo/Idh/MocA family oxidoreductase [Bacteroidales bacterium]
MDKIISIGILGTASIAKRFVIPAIQAMPEYYYLTGVSSRGLLKAKKYAEEFNIKPIEGYDKLINSDDIDAVYIPLPNNLHADYIEKALNKGLHVIVEKSLACHYADALRLNNLAKKRGLVLYENFQFRFHNQTTQILEMVRNGLIGELRAMRSSFGFPPFSDEDNIRYQKELGGGALLDAGAYTIMASQLFLGKELTVKAANLFTDSSLGVDIWGGGYLTQQNGKLFSEVAFGFDNHYQCGIELWGSEGKLTTNRLFTAPPGFKPTVEIETYKGKENIQMKEDNHFEKMLIHFYNLVTSGKNV